MDNYASAIRQWKVQKTLAFATSALRNASNGMQFVDIVKERTGIEISIISGEREAEYISIGVSAAVELIDRRAGAVALLAPLTQAGDEAGLATAAAGTGVQEGGVA